MQQILIVDDELGIRHSFKKSLEKEFRVDTAENGNAAIQKVDAHCPDLVLMDIKMPGLSGIETLQKIRESHPDLPVVMMTAFGDTQKAIEAMKVGAFDYLLKPLQKDDLRRVIDKALRVKQILKRSQFTVLDKKFIDPGDMIVGNSDKMIEVYKLIGQVAPTDVTVLILGESGTGKELVARAIFQNSRRAAGHYMAVNCAALPENLLETELFGYEKGAFTGASDKTKPGKLETCTGGTLLLDEIGDMSPVTQAKILRVLQDGQFQRVGGVENIKVDVRILAATNKDLDAEIQRGAFRKDLLHRLNVVVIQIPPLRERKEDIPDLVKYMIHRFDRQLGVDIRGFTPEFLGKLQVYSWPGNVRELENLIKKAMVTCQTNVLSVIDCHLPKETGTMELKGERQEDLSTLIHCRLKEKFTSSDHPFDEIIQEVEKALIEKALDMTQGNQLKASHLLGIARTTLRKKIKDFGIEND